MTEKAETGAPGHRGTDKPGTGDRRPETERRLQSLRLIVILDDSAALGRDLAELAEAAVRGGATMLQVRAKSLAPGALAELTRRVIAAAGNVPVLVNDRLDVALAAGAAGCHLGQDDFPLSDARAMVPAGFILGGSAGTTAEAELATRGGAHYLGVGPVHTTPHKPDAGAAIGADGLARIVAATRLPCVAIGGITAADIPALRTAGAAGIAVIGAVLGAEDPERATGELREALG